MPPVGFEPIISKGEWPQNDALDRAATGTGDLVYISVYICNFSINNKKFPEDDI
jgi:hypothetical protein